MEFNLQSTPPGSDVIERDLKTAHAKLVTTEQKLKWFGISIAAAYLILGGVLIGLHLSDALVELITVVEYYNDFSACAVFLCVIAAASIMILTFNGLGLITVDIERISNVISTCNVLICFVGTTLAGIIVAEIAFMEYITSILASAVVCIISVFIAIFVTLLVTSFVVDPILNQIDAFKRERNINISTVEELEQCNDSQLTKLRERQGNEMTTRYLQQTNELGRDLVQGEYWAILRHSPAPIPDDNNSDYDVLDYLNELERNSDDSKKPLIAELREYVTNSLQQPILTGKVESSDVIYQPNKQFRKLSMI